MCVFRKKDLPLLVGNLLRQRKFSTHKTIQNRQKTMKRTFILTLLAILVITPFCACKKVSRDTDPNYPKPESYKMTLTIGNKTFTATLDVNASADAFRAQLPLTLDMTDYGGFEKIYKLDVKLPYNDKLEESLGLAILRQSRRTQLLPHRQNRQHSRFTGSSRHGQRYRKVGEYQINRLSTH